MKRREFLRLTAAASAFSFFGIGCGRNQPERPNILLITADDLGYDFVGAAGCPVPNIAPNIDQLASEGAFFHRYYANIAVCQPVRSVMMTGLYPPRNGALGFEPIRRKVTTLVERLKSTGYHCSSLAKMEHLEPAGQFPWDFSQTGMELGYGRNSEAYGHGARTAIKKAQEQGRPFFLMANSMDPHRPLAGSEREKNREEKFGFPFRQPSRIYSPDEAYIPPYLPDLPGVRQEMAWYANSVRRCDDTVGAILKALDESGQKENTLVLFLGDHGPSQPFAKSNCYPQSGHSPLLLRWPERIQPGLTDTEHLLGSVDLFPTLLEAVGLPPEPDIDGRSFLPLFQGQKQEREKLYFFFQENDGGGTPFPIRAVLTPEFEYIYNAWSNGESLYTTDSIIGLAFQSMQARYETNPEIRERIDFFRFRTPEEFYLVGDDPYCLDNRIEIPAHQEQIRKLQQDLLSFLESIGDPLAANFREFLKR